MTMMNYQAHVIHFHLHFTLVTVLNASHWILSPPRIVTAQKSWMPLTQYCDHNPLPLASYTMARFTVLSEISGSWIASFSPVLLGSLLASLLSLLWIPRSSLSLSTNLRHCGIRPHLYHYTTLPQCLSLPAMNSLKARAGISHFCSSRA